MKVAVVTFLYPPFHGGVANSTYGLCCELARRGHDVTVYTGCSFHGTKALKEEFLDGVTIRRVTTIFPDSLVFDRIVLNPWEILRDIKKRQPDLVHFHGLGFMGNDIAAISLKKIPFVLTGGGPGWSHDPSAHWYYPVIWETYMKLLGQKVLNHMDRLIAITPHEVPYWLERGVPQHKIEIIPWGIPEDCFLPHNSSEFREHHDLDFPLLLYVGALHPAKGPQWLIKALPKVLQQFPSAKAILCGPDVGYRAYLVTLSQQLGVEKQVLIRGYISREELLKYYAACDVFVLPTDYEAFGLVLAEAMAFGKPIVASRVGAVPFVVEDGSNGFLVKPRDFLSLAEKILILLRDEQLRFNFGQWSKALSLKYSWKNTAQRYEEVYLSCVSHE